MRPRRWEIVRAVDGRAFTVESVTTDRVLARGPKGQRVEFDPDQLELVKPGEWRQVAP